MRDQLRPALFLLAVAAPLLSPAGGPAQPPASSRERTVSAGKMNYSWFQFDLPPGRYRVDWRVHGQCWSAEGDVPEGGTLKVFVSG
jgi:hypothetical protein